MKHFKPIGFKAQFEGEQSKLFLSLFEGEEEFTEDIRKIAFYKFIMGLDDIAISHKVFYSDRHIRRITSSLLNYAVYKLINKELEQNG